MTVTVEVNATWRVSRVNFNLAITGPQSIHGDGEVLLQEAPNPDPEAAILKQSIPLLDPKTYGSMPGAIVHRLLTQELLAETITLDGVELRLADVMKAINLFMEKWRIEDTANKPTP